MATETIALLIDDREGGSAGRMGTFASKGAPYEIDLSEKEHRLLRRAAQAIPGYYAHRSSDKHFSSSGYQSRQLVH